MHISRLIKLLLLPGIIFCQNYIIQSRDDTTFVQSEEGLKPVLDSLINQEPYWGKFYLLKDIKDGKQIKLNYIQGFEALTVDSIHIQGGQRVRNSTRQLLFKPLLHTRPDHGTRKSLEWLSRNYSWLDAGSELGYGIYAETHLAAVVNYFPSFASHISGVMGLSRTKNGNWDGQGELDLRLENLGGQAGVTQFKWRRPDNQTQRVYLAYEEPFTFGLPLGISFEIEQELIRGSYLKNARTAMVSSISRLGLWSIGGKSESFKDTEDDSTGIQAEFRSVSIRFRGDTRNHRWLPSQGNNWDLRLEIGQDFKREASSFYELSLNYGIYTKIRGRSLIFLGFWGRGIWMKKKLHPGKFTRYGGSSTLRGYREEQFSTDRVLITSGEWLFFASVRHQIFLFSEAAIQKQIIPLPFSYGLGYRRDTPRLVFSIAYGLGREDTFSSGKLHLKVITKL
ncbi:MAG: BamA/TamA family outer membrane protein [Candidatus Neomarinimicrobiota bacterium]